MNVKKPVVVCFICLSLLSVSGCSHMSTEAQRALSGGAIGAAGGAAVTALAGGPILGGMLIGAAGGAAIGALTTPNQVSLDKRH
ncbi:hypothetical protein [Telmatospirillum siberiense]|uniref:Glycine zipper domain-containing protein n=1 Tax=Telmatospirillum siberiense TaxID=382514 RepID=A0A2N3PYX1_9PROT|nr:hypothetical protein [Telmatospirillum siberiense]PKU25579.1 hypothetical protein CWS72_05825 [Telmatospirillum siberiense]